MLLLPLAVLLQAGLLQHQHQQQLAQPVHAPLALLLLLLVLQHHAPLALLL
jgi:hypothetical protein